MSKVNYKYRIYVDFNFYDTITMYKIFEVNEEHVNEEDAFFEVTRLSIEIVTSYFKLRHHFLSQRILPSRLSHSLLER